MMLAVNQPYPTPNPSPGTDYARISVMEGGSFDLLMYMNNPSKKEIEAAKTGKLMYAVFENMAVPFFCIEFRDAFSFDASLNMHKVDKAQQEAWLDAEANAVNLILIDSRNNKIKSLRMIGLEPEAMSELKKSCRQQLSFYANHLEVDRAILKISAQYSTDDMIVHSKVYRL